jgi:hypothetical protein
MDAAGAISTTTLTAAAAAAAIASAEARAASAASAASSTAAATDTTAATAATVGKGASRPSFSRSSSTMASWLESEALSPTGLSLRVLGHLKSDGDVVKYGIEIIVRGATALSILGLGQDQNNQRWIVEKRFSQFDQAFQALRRECVEAKSASAGTAQFELASPTTRAALAALELPPKGGLFQASGGTEFIKARTQGLAVFLDGIQRCGALCKSRAIGKFLSAPKDVKQRETLERFLRRKEQEARARTQDTAAADEMRRSALERANLVLPTGMANTASSSPSAPEEVLATGTGTGTATAATSSSPLRPAPASASAASPTKRPSTKRLSGPPPSAVPPPAPPASKHAQSILSQSSHHSTSASGAYTTPTGAYAQLKLRLLGYKFTHDAVLFGISLNIVGPNVHALIGIPEAAGNQRWIVDKPFSAFVALRDELRSRHATIMSSLPSFPDDAYLSVKCPNAGEKEKAYLAARVNGLNAWISAIITKYAVLCEDAAFQDTFLRGSISRGEVKRRETVSIVEPAKEKRVAAENDTANVPEIGKDTNVIASAQEAAVESKSSAPQIQPQLTPPQAPPPPRMYANMGLCVLGRKGPVKPDSQLGQRLPARLSNKIVYDIEVWLRTQESKALAGLDADSDDSGNAHRWVATRSYSEFAEFLKKLKSETGSRKAFDKEVEAIISEMDKVSALDAANADSEAAATLPGKKKKKLMKTQWQLPPKLGLFSKATPAFLQDREDRLGLFLSGLCTSNAFMESGAARDFFFAMDAQARGDAREAAVVLRETETEWKDRVARKQAALRAAAEAAAEAAARSEEDAVARVLAVAARAEAEASATSDAAAPALAQVEPPKTLGAAPAIAAPPPHPPPSNLGAAPTIAAPALPAKVTANPPSNLGVAPTTAAPAPPAKVTAKEEKRKKVEADRLRRMREMEKEEADRRRKKEEAIAAAVAEKKRLEEEEERKRLAIEEAQRRRKAAEAEEKRRAEEEKRRVEEDMRRAEEEKRHAAAERKRKEQEAARLETIERETRERVERETREKMAAEAERKRQAEEDARRRREAAEAADRKRQAEEEAQRRREAAEAAQAEERKRKEQEAARLETIERETRERVERETREKMAAEAERKRQAEEEAQRRREAAEAAERKRQAEEEAQRCREAAEAEERKRLLEEEAQRRRKAAEVEEKKRARAEQERIKEETALRQKIEKETRERVERETRERVERETRERVERETREKLAAEAEQKRLAEEEARDREEAAARLKQIESETRERVERETRERLAAEDMKRKQLEKETRRRKKATELERKKKQGTDNKKKKAATEDALRLTIEHETRLRVESEVRARMEREYSPQQARSTTNPNTGPSKGAVAAAAQASRNSEMRRDISVISAASATADEEGDAEQNLLEEMKDHVRTLSATNDISTLTSNWGAGGDDFDF